MNGNSYLEYKEDLFFKLIRVVFIIQKSVRKLFQTVEHYTATAYQV